YYAGARLLTLGQVEQGRLFLSRCLELECDCLERWLAQSELAQQAGPPTEAAPEAIQEVRRLNEEVIRLFHLGQDAQATTLATQAVSLAQDQLGEQYPELGESLNNLAGLCRASGDFARAESLYLQAIHITRHTRGEYHSSYAADLNNLASLYQALGDY